MVDWATVAIAGITAAAGVSGGMTGVWLQHRSSIVKRQADWAHGASERKQAALATVLELAEVRHAIWSARADPGRASADPAPADVELFDESVKAAARARLLVSDDNWAAMAPIAYWALPALATRRPDPELRAEPSGDFRRAWDRFVAAAREEIEGRAAGGGRGQAQAQGEAAQTGQPSA